MTEQKFYKIQHAKTKLYSKGGGPGSLSWSKTAGKTWNSIGALRNHITQHLPTSGSKRTTHDIGDWEIIEFIVTEMAPKPISEMMSDKQLVQLLTHSS